jgi:hypothetical protein
MKKIIIFILIFLLLFSCAPANFAPGSLQPGSTVSARILPDLGQSAFAPQISLVSAPFNQMGIAHPKPAAATNCTSSSPASAAYTVTICFSNPAGGSTLTGNVTVTATTSVTGTSPGVQRVIFYLDHTYLLTDYQSFYSFTLPTTKWVDGSHTLSAEVLMRDNFTSGQASISVNFKNGITTPPVNSNQFRPSSGNPPASGAPFVVAAGGDGASGETRALNVSNLIASLNPNLFLYLGDVYEKGSPAEFYNWYGTTTTNFGRFRSITNPTVGNHEYLSSSSALGYFDYWNNVPNYYSYNAGGWHFISLNSNAAAIGLGPTSAQYKWLQQDLAANAGVCTIAYYHHPLFNIGPQGPATSMTSIWKLLAQYGVDIVLNGHEHSYQRWVPLDGNGQPSPSGITEFAAGNAGHGLQAFSTSDSRVAYSNSTSPTAYGILLLRLNPTSASFSYQNINGSTLDSGVIPCTPITPTATPTATATSTSIPLPTNTPTATPTSVSLPTSTPTATSTTTVSQSITFTPDADTYVNAGSTGTNYGTSIALRADASPDVHSYLRFSVSGLGGKTISKARLMIFANSSLTQGINAVAVTDNTWGEVTMNYTNAPPLGGTLATSGAIATGSWVTLDVTSYITGEGTFSLGIVTPSSTAISLASRETGANSPQLIIDLK